MPSVATVVVCWANTYRVCMCLPCLCVQVREPQPLTLHHLPFSHTFALFEVRHCWLLLLLPGMYCN